MDLSKYNLSPTDQTALSVASSLASQNTKNIMLTNVGEWTGKENIMDDFAPAFRIHQELIDALESNGYSIIDGTADVMRVMIQQAINAMKIAKMPPGVRKVVLLYKAEWVQGSNSKIKTIIVDYHVFVVLQPTGTDRFENFNSIGSAKFPLTQGVTMRDFLFDQYIKEITSEEDSGDSES